jgi:hypothetical protein
VFTFFALGRANISRDAVFGTMVKFLVCSVLSIRHDGPAVTFSAVRRLASP